MAFDVGAFPKSIVRLRGILAAREIQPRELGVVLPEVWYDHLLLHIRSGNPHLIDRPFSPRTMLRAGFHFWDIEILRGDPDQVWPMACIRRDLDGVIYADREALILEIEGCFQGCCVAELPQSASSNGVSPSAKTVGEVRVTASAAGRDNGNSNRMADLSHEEKIIAAKAAIAVYAREKNLPSAKTLALFGELDRAKASGGAAAVGVDLAEAGADRTVWAWASKRLEMDPVSLPTSEELCRGFGGRQYDFIAFDEASDLGCGAPANINRHAHRLSSESLSRAADQIWSANSGGTYADLVCSRPERLAEMVYRGDAAADGERT